MSLPVDQSRLGPGPVVSIIVPAYRAEAYLGECLGSLLAQTHPALQIVVVDDGSPDASAQIAMEWASQDERVQVIRRPHSGAAAARNAGLAAVTGEYVTFVDADDVVHPDYVMWLLEASQVAGADLVASSLSQYLDGGEPEYRAPTAVTASAPEDVLERIVTTGVGFASCGKLARADLLADVRYREGLPFEDLGVLPDLFAAATLVAETDAIGYGYRRYDESTEGGHQRLLKTDLLRVLALNVAAARVRYGPDSVRARRLIVGYVLHAAKSLEAQAGDASTREPDYDEAYRALLRDAVRDLRHADDLSVAYKMALTVSAISPSAFVNLFRVARGLKATVLPQLRRR